MNEGEGPGGVGDPDRLLADLLSRFAITNVRRLFPYDPLVGIQESRRRPRASDVILRLLGVRRLKQLTLI